MHLRKRRVNPDIEVDGGRIHCKDFTQSGNCGATEARAEETARIKNNNCIRLEMQFQKALVTPVLFLCFKAF